MFNQATTLCHVRPYDASIFIAAQIGDIAQVEALMARGLASVYDTDQYGLDLVYVRGVRSCFTVHRSPALVRGILLFTRLWSTDFDGAAVALVATGCW